MTRKPHPSTPEFPGRPAPSRLAALVVDARLFHHCVDAARAPGQALREALDA